MTEKDKPDQQKSEKEVKKKRFLAGLDLVRKGTADYIEQIRNLPFEDDPRFHLFVKNILKKMQNSYSIFFSSRQEMGLYVQITESLKSIMAVQTDSEVCFSDEKMFASNLKSYIDSCTAFLQYLKVGNEDYGQSEEFLN